MLFFCLIFYSAILFILTYYSHTTADYAHTIARFISHKLSYLKKKSECIIIKQTHSNSHLTYFLNKRY